MLYSYLHSHTWQGVLIINGLYSDDDDDDDDDDNDDDDDDYDDDKTIIGTLKVYGADFNKWQFMTLSGGLF